MEYFYLDPVFIAFCGIVIILGGWTLMSMACKPSIQGLRYHLAGELHALEESLMSWDATIGRYKNKPGYDAAAAEKARDFWRNGVEVHQSLLAEFTVDSDEAAIKRMIAHVETGQLFLRRAQAALPDCCETDQEALLARRLLNDVGSQIVDKRD